MIKPNQIIAARGLLRWSRDDLAEASGIHAQTIKKIETGDTDNPRSNTLDPIIEAFGRKGVEFIDGGVREKKDKIRILEGQDAYLKLMDEAFHVLRKSIGKKEIIVANADQSLSPNSVIESQNRLLKFGVNMRFTVCEGDEYLLYPLQNYRYIPKDDFLNSLVVIFDDYLAITIRGENKITVIHDDNVAEVFRRQFNKLWNFYKQPTISSLETKND